MTIFEQMTLPGVASRIVATMLLPTDPRDHTVVCVTIDPPTDAYEVMWYRDTMSTVMTADEAVCALEAMLEHALTNHLQQPGTY